MLVVGTADRNISVFNMSNPSQPYKTLQSPLKFQTRCARLPCPHLWLCRWLGRRWQGSCC